MIFAGRNGILNNGGTPRKGASALHTETIANTATAFRFMDSIRAKKLATVISPCGLSHKWGERSEGGEAGLLSFVANQDLC